MDRHSSQHELSLSALVALLAQDSLSMNNDEVNKSESKQHAQHWPFAGLAAAVFYGDSLSSLRLALVGSLALS